MDNILHLLFYCSVIITGLHRGKIVTISLLLIYLVCIVISRKNWRIVSKLLSDATALVIVSLILWPSQKIGLSLFGLGIFLNFIVIQANSGMPVKLSHITSLPKHLTDKGYRIESSATKFPYLCDRFNLPLIGLLSLGDFIMCAGEISIIVQFLKTLI